jgi:hypothetical protein
MRRIQEIDFLMKRTTEWSFKRQKSTDTKEIRTKIAGLGIFVNVIWVFSIFVRPVIDSILFLSIGGLSLLITVVARIQLRNMKTTSADEISGGSIVGYVFAWFLVNGGYPNITQQIPSLALTVNQLLIFYLVLVFFSWFAIPTTTNFSEMIFGMSPLISYFILNFWKLVVIFEILTMFSAELRSLSPVAELVFVITGFTELIIQYTRLYKFSIVDIILDPQQLLLKTIQGPLQAVKWSILVIGFLILDILPLDLLTVALVAFSLTIGFISLSTALTKTVLDSGVIRSNVDGVVEEGKVIIPKMFEELKQVEASDIKEFYRVTDTVTIKKKNKVVKYENGDTLLKLPFTSTLEKEAGVFVANIKFDLKGRSTKRKRKLKQDGISMSIQTSVTKSNKKTHGKIKMASLNRITSGDWINLQKNKQIESVEIEAITSAMGFESPEEFEKMIEKGIRGTISIQENIRDRIRGVPITTSTVKSKIVKIKNRQLEIPDKMFKQIKLADGQELELIPGKDEFLFYARIKKDKKTDN